MNNSDPTGALGAPLPAPSQAEQSMEANEVMSFADVWVTLKLYWKRLVAAPLCVGLVALGGTYLIAPTYTATLTFMPPQQGQSAAASALASLGSLSALAGGTGAARNTGEQYVALMQSVTVSDRIIDHFKLMPVYEAEFRVDARRLLTAKVRMSFGKKDGLINVEVDDTDAQRAADIANRYADELGRMTATLAVTEAQQRRVFFDRQLAQSRDRLTQAQQALQDSGFNAGALKTEPKAAADSYARLKAEATAAEVRLQVLRTSLTEDAAEVRQQRANLSALRGQLARAEEATASPGGVDYVSRYREFKYQETLFELYARQLELARADESREGALIQVVDRATPPEKKSKPKRAIFALAATLATFLALVVFLLTRDGMRRLRSAPSA